MRIKESIFFIGCGFILSACDSGPNYAPVTEIATIEPIPKTGLHHVTHGETLYEIAWRYGFDYRYLAKQNHLRSPYVLHTGQVIKLNGKAMILQPLTEQESSVPPFEPILAVNEVQSLSKKSSEIKTYKAKTNAWILPTQGKILTPFSQSHKGINIAGTLGQPIYAAASGKVVYCGDGLRGYGNLIILKHNNVYLSAYAHNKDILVQEGDEVSQGQKIAEMGNTGADKTILHFEIRRAGKPINPLTLMNARKA